MMVVGCRGDSWMYNPIVFIVTDPCLFQSGQGRVLPFCTSERPVHLLYTILSPVSDRLKWETVDPVPLSDRALLRPLYEHVQEQWASDHRDDHTYGDTGGTNHSSDAVAHDEECTSNVAVIGLRL